METVKQVLMRRDHMDAEAADEMIEEFQSQVNELLENESNNPMMLMENLEDMLKDWFGLEPDYLMEFF